MTDMSIMMFKWTLAILAISVVSATTTTGTEGIPADFDWLDVDAVMDLLNQHTSSDRQAGNTVKHMFSDVLFISLYVPHFCSTPRCHSR